MAFYSFLCCGASLLAGILLVGRVQCSGTRGVIHLYPTLTPRNKTRKHTFMGIVILLNEDIFTQNGCVRFVGELEILYKQLNFDLVYFKNPNNQN